MRLEIDGGKTNYEGVYAVTKHSKLSVVKSKVSPIMGGFPIIIDITRGGVIDQAGSFVWWMTELTNPNIFKIGSWWSLEEWAYNKYKPYWDKFELNGKFRQKRLYELAATDPSFINVLELIWLDLLSDRYLLQREVIKGLRDRIEAKLLMDLDITYDEIPQESNDEEYDSLKDTTESLMELSEILDDGLSGEVTEDKNLED